MTPGFLQPSVIELDKAALQNNILFLKNRAENGVKISSVIKGNAYGHGISSFLPMAEEAGIDHFSVFSANEAEIATCSKNNPDTKVMIMGMIRDEELEWAILNGVEFYVFEKERLKSAAAIAQKVGKRASVHLQMETGMNRTGFDEHDWEALFRFVKKNEGAVNVCGICTHFAGAESVANFYRIQNQDAKLRKAISIAQKFIPLPKVHAASSAAYLTYPEKQFDMARIGIAQYGFWPSRETYMYHMKSEKLDQGSDPLKRVLTWKSEIMSLKEVESGDFIGYGNVYLAGKNMKIATVPIGYTHGFGRNLTNSGYVLIHGERCGVVGLVNMNMITVNVSNLENVKIGDEVVLIGRQGDDEITVASFGEMTNNLNYEVLTRLPTTIPRIVC
ncbi:MAG: alanine racemase [Balneolaceae bacterium]|nr:MAG: alanine racemase [Balneolaceae bacterium]